MEGPGKFVDVLGMDQMQIVAADQFIGAVAQHALMRRADIADHAVLADDADQIERVFDQRTKMLFAPLQGFDGVLALRCVAHGAD